MGGKGEIYFVKNTFKKVISFYINVTGIVFYQCNSYQIVFSHTTRIKNFLFIVGNGESNKNTVESIELNCKTHEKHYEVKIHFMPWIGQMELIILIDAYNRLFLLLTTPGQYCID